jgi:hypothetical protein
MHSVFDVIVNNLSNEAIEYFKKDTQFYITREEFEEFKKECNFYILKEEPIGQKFCEKYNQHNGVLMILNGDMALRHIEKFYIK